MPEPKKKVGIFLPEPLAQALDELAKTRVSGKEKWIVASAAVLALLELDDEQQNAYIRRLKNADSPGRTFAELIKEAEKTRGGVKMVTRTAEGEMVEDKPTGRGGTSAGAGRRRQMQGR